MPVPLLRIASHPELPHPYRGHIALQQKRPVLPHLLDEPLVAPSAERVHAPPPAPTVHMRTVDQPVRHTEPHRPLPRPGAIIRAAHPLHNHQPIPPPLHPQQPLRAPLRRPGPHPPAHRPPQPPRLVPQITPDHPLLPREPPHHRLPMLDPLLLRLLDPAQRPQILVMPTAIAQVRPAAPRRARDVVIDNDPHPGLAERARHRGEHVQRPHADEVSIRGEPPRGDDGVGGHHLVRVREPHGVEAHGADEGGDGGAGLDVEARGDEELVRAAVPVYGGEFDARGGGVVDVAAVGVEGGVEEGGPAVGGVCGGGGGGGGGYGAGGGGDGGCRHGGSASAHGWSGGGRGLELRDRIRRGGGWSLERGLGMVFGSGGGGC